MGSFQSVSFKNDLVELERLKAALDEAAEAFAIPPKVLFEINVSLDELLTNVISYGFPDGGEHEIQLEIEPIPDGLKMVLSDGGAPFNPIEAEEPDLDCPVEERRIGGLGIMFVRKMMNTMDYAREGDRNVVTLTKVWEAPAEAASDSN